MSGGLLEKAKDIPAEDADEIVAEGDGTAADSADQVVDSGGLLARADAVASSDAGQPFLTAQAKKGIAGGVVGLLILFILMQAVLGFSFGEHSISVSAVEIDEADDALRVQVFIGTPMFRGVPDDDLQIRIIYGEMTAFSDSFTPQNKLSWYEIPFDSFYQGNSRAAASDLTDIVYTLEVRQGTSTASSYPITPQMMDRTITAVDGELTAVTEATECDDQGNCEKNGLDHVGASLRVGAGVPDPVESNSSGLLLHTDSDYTMVASVSFMDSVVYTSQTISVDGSTATWNGGGGLVESGWLDIEGSGSKANPFGGDPISYIPRGEFYDGDGCYVIEITVTHESPFGDVYSNNSIQGYEFWWEYNENRDTSSEDTDGDGVADTEGEPYKPTEAC